MAAAAKPATKSEIVKTLSEATSVSKKDVAAIMEALSDFIKKQLGKKGPGVFALPGLVKVRVVMKKATKAREGINPATGEKIMIKAKPARKVVKAAPLKALKDVVLS
jgi:nucleoid DNA-binding protein